jgi:hypothetical protein
MTLQNHFTQLLPIGTKERTSNIGYLADVLLQLLGCMWGALVQRPGAVLCRSTRQQANQTV